MAVYGPANNEELYHYGIKRKSGRYPWGSGKEPYQSNPAMAKKAAAANASKKPETFWEKRRKAQAVKARINTKTKAKEMSDADLRKAVNRMQLENQYNQLSKNRISKGRKFLKDVNTGAVKIAAVTTTAITLYNNYTKLLSIVDAIQKKKG